MALEVEFRSPRFAAANAEERLVAVIALSLERESIGIGNSTVLIKNKGNPVGMRARNGRRSCVSGTAHVVRQFRDSLALSSAPFEAPTQHRRGVQSLYSP